MNWAGTSISRNAICDIDALKSAIASLREQIGPITVLVNNAARDDRHDWREVTEEYWNERAATNIRHRFSPSKPAHLI